VTSRTVLIATVVLLAVALAVLVGLLTPWRPLSLHGAQAVATDPARDFTAAQLAREDAYHSAVRPPAYVSLALSLVFACVLGFSPVGARLVERVAAPLGGGWGWQVLLGGIAVTLLGRLLVLPWDAWSESVRRRYGLSTRSWGAWAVDVAKAYGVGLVLTLVVLFLVVGLARWSPQWWWTLGAALGALLVVVVSFAYPVVVEPVFNKFEPMRPGELRSSLLALARDDGVRVEDVLVADASRRTSSLNAYVSGFGSTRRIVVYDTLLDSASDREIELIVAHELGHAKQRDVVWGTLLGALGVALLVCLLALVTRSSGVLSRAGVPSLADGRSIALVLAVLAVLGFVSGPAQALLSRRVETRADVHALQLTRGPDAMIAMQRRLSTRNLSDLDPSPIVFGMFSTHPTGPQRIALARTWAALNGVPVPPSSVQAAEER
jgi:STE24 endopeptidase